MIIFAPKWHIRSSPNAVKYCLSAAHHWTSEDYRRLYFLVKPLCVITDMSLFFLLSGQYVKQMLLQCQDLRQHCFLLFKRFLQMMWQVDSQLLPGFLAQFGWSATLSSPNELLFCPVSEFLPYVFQVLSLLLEIRRDEIPEPYMKLFPLLLSPVLWERTGMYKLLR